VGLFDRGVDGVPLHIRYKSHFQASDEMGWVGWGEWEFRWKWNLDTFDQDLLGDQIVTLHDVCFSNREDEWCWRQENREAFVLRHIPLSSSTSVSDFVLLTSSISGAIMHETQANC
jgi:hypothetical protein